jgi:hypothetical protein
LKHPYLDRHCIRNIENIAKQPIMDWQLDNSLEDGDQHVAKKLV